MPYLHNAKKEFRIKRLTLVEVCTPSKLEFVVERCSTEDEFYLLKPKFVG